ncbi:MAG TPA: ParA family protein [Thermoanaerobaculia bacterium]|nr:ParA family protein [Thermoanaerobaculia bacterium]
MILTLVNNKGGVGKTTTAVSLAAALAEQGLRVLLVDVDSQASASLSVGLGRAELSPSVADVLLRGKPSEQAIRSTTTPGLHVLPGSVDLVSAEEDLSTLPRKELLLRQALERVRGDYDYVFVDCPPGLGLLTRNALVAADGFLVPVVPHFLAAEGVEGLLEAVGRLAWRTQSKARLVGILATMVDMRTRAARETLDALRSRYHDRVFALEIRGNVRLAEAPSLGRTIFQHDRECVGARAYALLAEELLARLGRPTREDAAVTDRRPAVAARPEPSASLRWAGER